MSDVLKQLTRQVSTLDDRLEVTQTREVPPLYLPCSQEVLTPNAINGATTNRFPLPWSVTVVAVYASVYVNAPNDANNYWNLVLATGGTFTVIATATTSGAAAGTWTRLVWTIAAQPASTDKELEIAATKAGAVGAPGAIYVVPAVAVLRTGN